MPRAATPHRLPRHLAIAAAWRAQVEQWETARRLLREHRQAAAQAPPLPLEPASTPGDHRFEWVPTLPRQVCALCHAETDVTVADGAAKRIWWVDGVATDERPSCRALPVVAPPADLTARKVVEAELVDDEPLPDIVVARAPRRRPPRTRARTAAPRPTAASTRPAQRPPSRETQAFLEDLELESGPDAATLRAIEHEVSTFGITHADIAGERELELIREAQAGEQADEQVTKERAAAEKERRPLNQALLDSLRLASLRGRRAADTLLRAHDKLVRMYAARYSRMAGSRHGVDFDDLLQESRRGFLQGVMKFTTKFGNKLSTYAAYWMLQCMGRTLDKTRGLVVLPYNVIERAKRAQRQGLLITADTLKAAGKGKLNPEIAECGAAVWSGRDISVYETVGGGGADEEDNGSLKVAGYLQSDEDVQENVVEADLAARRAELVQAALASLTDQEREVARRRLMTDPPDTLEAIGRDLKMTRENARLIEVKVGSKLRAALMEVVRANDVAAEVLGEAVDAEDEELDEAA